MAPYADVDSSTPDYARRFAGPVGELFLQRQAALVKRAITDLAANSPPSMLDVGGGHGQIARVSASLQIPTTVLVSAPEAVGQLKTISGNITVREGDLCASGLPERSFDLVTCFRLLPHCDKWTDLVAELCRLSANEVLIDYPPFASSNVLYGLLFAFKRRLEGNTRAFRLFSHREVEQTFAEHGFVPVWREGQYLFPMVLYRALKSPLLLRALESPGAWCGMRKHFGNPTVALFRRTATSPKSHQSGW